MRLRNRLLSWLLALAAGGLLLQEVGQAFLEAYQGARSARLRSSSRTGRIPRRQQDLSRSPGAPVLEVANARSGSYQLLSQREHVLHRPDMYIGPVEPRKEMAWVMHGQRMEERSLIISPGLVQIFNEILVNAIDRQFHSGMSEIRVEVNKGTISISNDGGPIPIEKHESGHFVPTLVFGEFLSGDNFNDTKVRFTGGRNGVGAKATNAFSRSFEVVVDDPGTGQRFFQRWENNMLDRGEPKIEPLPKGVRKGSVIVRFEPDLQRFGLKRISADHMKILKARAFDAAACTRPGVKVYFNGKAVTAGDFEAYSRRVLGKSIANTKILDASGSVRAEVAVGFTGDVGFSSLGFVNGMRCSRGTHVKYAVEQLTAGIQDLASEGGSKPSSATIKQYLRVVVKVLVDNPDFDSQTKTRLTTTTEKLGFDFVLPPSFVREVAELGVLQAAIRATQVAQQREMQQVLGSGAAPSTAKLDDALNAGKKGKACTLILTEGDSAKALAVAGLAKIGRANYGVFPLKGKPLNVRSATDKQIQANQEIKNLMHILGLDWGQVFSSPKEVADLRYQKVMIFSDQDLDGHHIAGLLLNLFLAKWPSLLEVQPDFIQRFATPLVKVFPRPSKGSKQDAEEFFTQGAFDSWQRSQGQDWITRFTAKYYKGLGTSTRDEALGYFSDMDRHVMNFELEGSEDREMIEKVFEPARADDRKTWLREYRADVELDYSQPTASYSDFLNQQMVHFSTYDCVRSIPVLLDGLKPSQRKVLYWALRSLKTGEKKVSQIVGLVSSATGYHHGEESLVKVIVNLAQDFVGTNNINLLEPIGMFGTRLNGRDVHASARYIHTKLAPIIRRIFPPEDLDLLPPQLEDGNEIEPRVLLPVVPLALVNGFQGIGTGWASQGANYDPLEVAEALENLIRGEPVADLTPSYRGFRGQVVQEAGKFYSTGAWTVYSSQGEGFPPDTVEITELPVGVWTHDFIESVEKKAKAKRIMLRVHKCHDHDDQDVHLLIGFDPSQLLKPGSDGRTVLEKTLGLKKRLHSNMWLYEIPHLVDGTVDARLEYFEDAKDVLSAFYSARLPFYAKRKEKLQRQIALEVKRLTNQARCIRLCREQKLELSELSACGLQEHGFEPIGSSSWEVEDEDDPKAEPAEAGFNYILQMPIRRFSSAQAEKLEEELAKAQEDLQRIEEMEEEEMWLEDLRRFKEAVGSSQEAAAPVKPLSTKDMRMALQTFAQERRKLHAKSLRNSNKEEGSLGFLKKCTTAQLQDICREHGLLCRSKKQDLVEILLRYHSAGFTGKDWAKLSVDELKAHLASRHLSEAGSRAICLKRLAQAPIPTLDFASPTSKLMKSWLSDFGLRLPAGTSMQEVEQRYLAVMLRMFQEEASVMRLDPKDLQELVPREADAPKDRLANSLAKSHVLARSDDLGTPMKTRFSNKEMCWAKCIQAAREDLGLVGFQALTPGTALFGRLRDCFQKECAKFHF